MSGERAAAVPGSWYSGRVTTYEHDTDTPDIESSSEGYRRRFVGEVGRFFLETQSGLLLSQLRASGMRLEGASVLEVGGGHAQVTAPLLHAGAVVTVQGSAASCAQYVSQLPEWGSDRLRFVTSSLWALPDVDHSEDAVVAFRVMAHVNRWQELIAEMCRVSRHAVIIDFPCKSGMNALTPLLFRIKKRIEGNTRPYFSYRREDLEREFRKHGFTVSAVTKQFALPMGLHRALKSARTSRVLEACLRAVGITALLGSPAMLCAVRTSEAAS